MREVVQVFEHEVLQIEERGLTEAAFDALVRFNERHADRFFTVRHRSLKFANYVGVLQVGRLTVEVLPKADRGGVDDKKKWRDALIDMLRSCGYLKLAAVSSAQLHLRRASLFDLYMEAFLTEVRALLHHGLTRKYRRVTGNLTALKGRLLFNRHIAMSLVHRERFFAAYEHYDRNNRFNQILYLAVRIVSTSARSSEVRGAAGELLVWMEDIDDKPVSAETFARLRFDRNTERYRPALALAKMIILNYQPDVRAGGHDVLAILFDMNELFEEYVLRLLKRAASGYGVEVRRQHSQRFWSANGTTRSIRPDILITLPLAAGVAETVVLDTKWKVPVAAHPDDADLRQMYAYNLQCGATRSFLVYPRVDQRRDVGGEFEAPYHDELFKHSCGMWFVDLFDGHRLRRDIGAGILERLLPVNTVQVIHLTSPPHIGTKHLQAAQ
jgi:5-methylcytosine-specific restriction enzyme subunit McrC